jgi:hypothetical protein
MNSLPVSNNMIFAHEGNYMEHITNMRLVEIIADVRFIPASCNTTIMLPLHQTDSAPLSLQTISHLDKEKRHATVPIRRLTRNATTCT